MAGKRRDEQRTNFVVGIFVIAFGGLLIASLFLIAISEGVLTEKTTIRAHFRTVSGLTKQSKVQLAGKEIGVVTGLVGMTGGVGGFFLASSLGFPSSSPAAIRPVFSPSLRSRCWHS